MPLNKKEFISCCYGKIKTIIFYIEELYDIKFLKSVISAFKCDVWFVIEPSVRTKFLKQLLKHKASELFDHYKYSNLQELKFKINDTSDNIFNNILRDFLLNISGVNHFVINTPNSFLKLEINEKQYLKAVQCKEIQNTEINKIEEEIRDKINSELINERMIVDSLYFIQDLFEVFKFNGQNFICPISVGISEEIPLRSRYFEKTFGSLKSITQDFLLHTEMLSPETPLKAGNFFFYNNKLMIGKDILLHFNPDRSIYYLRDQSATENALINFFEVDSVIFIGAEHTHQINNQRSFQPFYHIDLFLTIVGKSKTDEDIFILAEIDPNFVFLKTQINESSFLIDTLKKGLEEIKKKLEYKFPKSRIIRIPIAIDGNYYYSYNNMQIENLQFGETINAYMPSYGYSKYIEPQIMAPKNFQQFKNFVKNKLESAGINTNFINYNFSEISAYETASLHCISKVISRSED